MHDDWLVGDCDGRDLVYRAGEGVNNLRIGSDGYTGL